VINYEGKVFRPVVNFPNGEVNAATRFQYSQAEDLLTASYSGGGIREGQMVGKVLPNGELEFFYQHMSDDGSLLSGRCHSRPEYMPDGRLRLHETWQWFTDGQSCGTSIVEEEAAS